MAAPVSVDFPARPLLRAGGLRLRRSAWAPLPTRHGPFNVVAFRDEDCPDIEHFVLVRGDLAAGEAPPLVRVHSGCLTGDIFGSRKCDCGEQKEAALARIAAEGRGAFLYVDGHEGRGIGLFAKVEAYALQADGANTVEANLALGLPVDARDYAAAALILRSLGVRSLRLLTNNPDKVAALAAARFAVERASLEVAPNPDNLGYLTAKALLCHHQLAFAQSGD